MKATVTSFGMNIQIADENKNYKETMEIYLNDGKLFISGFFNRNIPVDEVLVALEASEQTLAPIKMLIEKMKFNLTW